MYQLLKGLNAVRWTAATQSISTVAFVSLIDVVYTPNPDTGLGYVTNEPGDAASFMTVFAPGYDYLVKMKADYLCADFIAAPAHAFADFPGYVAAVPDTAPTVPVGRTETGYAAEAILGGRLVAQTPGGLRHYSSANLTHERLLFGVSLNSALPGGTVSVRRPGYVHYEGWGLPVGVLLLAGPDGQLVTEVGTTSFCQPIGRALDADTLIYQPENITFLSTPQKTA